MSTRMVPLWRSTGRCLALRPQSAAAASASAAFFRTSLPASTVISSRQSILQRTLVIPGSVRGYADDATRQPPPQADTISLSSQLPPQPSAPAPTPETPEIPATPAAPEVPAAPAAPAATEQSARSAADALAKAAISTGPALPTTESDLPSGDENRAALQQLAALSQGLAPFDAEVVGHNFGLSTASTRAAILPEDAEARDAAAMSLPVTPKLQERYDPVIHQCTRLMMRDGKLAKAQRDMATVLNFLRQSSPPNLNPSRPLLRGHLPAAQLPLDPAYYLALAIDSVAPLFKIRSVAGAAGGGRALPVPTPLAQRQRRRTAFMWLLDSVKNKQSRGSGRGQFATRVGEEIVAIAEGRSSLWEKRQLVHKLSTTARMNVGASGKKKKFVAKVI